MREASGPRRSLLLALAGVLSARAAAAKQTPAPREDPLPVFASLAALAEAAPPAAVGFASTLGHTRPGRGGAVYRRAEREPAHKGKIRARDGAWWEILAETEVSVTQFGAVGDGEADDAPAIQAAIDYCVYFANTPKLVRLPALRYRVTDTLHVGYGERYVTLTIQADPGPGREAGADETGLFPTFADRPALNIQGGRFVRLRGLAIVGVNYEHLQKTYDALPDRGQLAGWLGPRLGPEATRRHAPYAGVTIDAYAGPGPDAAYPPVAYPSFAGSDRQYGRNFSSNTVLENCRIGGFHVGLAVQPGQVPDASNGDFVTIRDCDLSYNVIGVADGHTDARCNAIENTRLHFCHTAIDAREHGPGNGQIFGPVTGSSFDNVWRLLNVNIGGSAAQGPCPLSFVSCYGESMHQLGTAFVEGRQTPGVSFEGCKFEFSIKNEEFSPAFLLRCGSGLASFRNCVLRGGAGFFAFDGDVRLDGVTLSQPQFVAADQHEAAGRLALSFTTQVFARAARDVRLSPIQFFDFSGRSIEFAVRGGLEGAAFDIAREASAPGRPLPWWVERLSDGEFNFALCAAAGLPLDRARHPLRVSEMSGADYTIAVPSSWDDELRQRGMARALALGPGDLLFDFATGAAAYVREADWQSSGEATLRVRQISGIRSRDGGVSFEIDAPLSEQEGLLTIFNARRLYPAPRRVAAETRKGERTLRLRPCGLTANAQGEVFAAPGDLMLIGLAAEPSERQSPAGAGVQQIDAQQGLVTLDRPLERSGLDENFLFVKSRLT